MGQAFIAIGQTLKWQKTVYEIKLLLDNGNILRLEDVEYGGKRIDVSRKEFLDAFERGEIRFPQAGKNVVTMDGLGEYALPDYEGLSEAVKRKYEFKKFAIEPLLGLKGKERSEAVNRRVQELSALDVKSTPLQFIEYVKKYGSPVRQTLYDWIRDIEKSQGDTRSLIPAYHRSGPQAGSTSYNQRMEEWFEDIALRCERGGEEITTDTIWSLLYTRVDEHNNVCPNDRLTCPSQSWVYRRLRRRNPEEVFQRKYGWRAAYDKYGNVGSKERGKKPMELVQADHLTLDLFLVDEKTRQTWKRCHLTILMDTNTRYILGYYLSLGHPNSASILYALRHAIRNKDYVKEKYPRVKGAWQFTGKPLVLLTDRGKDFMSRHIEETCDKAGVRLRHCVARCPWHKGEIERLFRTINMQIIHQMPGTTHSNPVERKRRNYDSEQNAAIPVSRLHEIIHIWIIDIYHKQKHRGALGVPENLLLERTKIEPIRLPDSTDWEDRIGLVEEGTIQDSGIRFQYLDYNSEELHELLMYRIAENKSLRLKFLRDPSDMGLIRVYDDEHDRYIHVPCRDFEYANGLPEFAHQMIIKKMNRDDRANRHDRALQKALIYQIKEEEVEKTKTARTERARMVDKGLDESCGVAAEEPMAEVAKPMKNRSAKVIELHRVDINNDDDWGGSLVRKDG